MITKIVPASEEESEILNLITEECAEVIQIISKINRFGFSSYNPNDKEKVINRDLLVQELGDIIALVEIAIDSNIINISELNDAVISKKERLKIYSNIKL